MTFDAWIKTEAGKQATERQSVMDALRNAYDSGWVHSQQVAITDAKRHYHKDRATIAGQIAASLSTICDGSMVENRDSAAREAVALADAVIAELVRTATK